MKKEEEEKKEVPKEEESKEKSSPKQGKMIKVIDCEEKVLLAESEVS